MPEYRIAGDEPPAYLQRHARIALTAVPVRVILGEPALVRDLSRLGLQFLQAHDVRSVALQPRSDLGSARPNAVHIPRGDFHASPNYLPRPLTAPTFRTPELFVETCGPKTSSGGHVRQSLLLSLSVL